MNIDMIRAARIRIDGRARHTPLLHSPFLDRIAGRRVFVKAECLQHTGSFKYRGATAALSALSPDARARGVIAFSSGNHAQGIARAAAEHQTTAVIVMPSDAPEVKIANTRLLGAEVVLYDRWRDDRDALSAGLAAERGLTLIPPFDAAEVIAGQGTVGLEIAEDAKAAGIGQAEVLVCCGGGGLTSGVALAVEADAPGLRVRPVEPENFDDVTRSLAAGRALRNDPAGAATICDAILTPMPGKLTLPILSRLCGPGLVISDDQALAAMALAFQHLQIVAEPGGAVALAAALYAGEALDGDTVIAIVTGGNVDPAVFGRALARLAT